MNPAYPFNSLVHPRDLPSPVRVWGWAKGQFMVDEIELTEENVPETEGKIVVRLAAKDYVVFDLAWGEYSREGSTRATYHVETK